MKAGVTPSKTDRGYQRGSSASAATAEFDPERTFTIQGWTMRSWTAARPSKLEPGPYPALPYVHEDTAAAWTNYPLGLTASGRLRRPLPLAPDPAPARTSTMCQPKTAFDGTRSETSAGLPISSRASPSPAMKRVAVFGNAGGGKSTLARHLAELTGLPLHVIDKIQYGPAGETVPHERYLHFHSELLRGDAWIIDGFGCVASAWERFAAADTLIHVDLPLALHHWWVTKRLIKGIFVEPEGWPAGSPIWSSSISSYKVLWQCHRRLTPRYRQMLAGAASKCVHRLRSPRAMRLFLENVRREQDIREGVWSAARPSRTYRC